MSEKTVLILERSSQNLKTISKNGRTILEGVFAEFGVENRNGRVYEEREYLPHLEYLQKDIANKNLLGELDHPERFEVSLSNVSHRIDELWYDQNKRQILGRIEILDGTPKGKIAKSLLEAGVPLSISSRAAGSVNDDKSVQIQQIYTYDLVAKPGFENAQLYQVNESANADPRMKKIASLLESFNSASNKRKEGSISNELGIMNENISIIDVTDKFPSVKLREEAKSLIQKNERIMEEKITTTNDAALQEWTKQINAVVEGLSKRLDGVENAILEGAVMTDNDEIKSIKGYIEKIRKIQESAINWQEDIAKSVNKIGSYADDLAKKGNKHYALTKKIIETVDYNAKTLNKTQDWVGHNAKVTNSIVETVDQNTKMLNGINEWTTDIAKSVNKLNEWGEEKAAAINGMHEWTSSIAKNLNNTANWAEDMFGRAMSKDDAKKLVEYIELVQESKHNAELREKIDEMLSKHSITSEHLNEASKLKSLEALTVDKIEKKTWKVDDTKAKDSVEQFAKQGKDDRGQKAGKAVGGKLPQGLSTLDTKKEAKVTVTKSGKKLIVLDTTETAGKKGKETVGGDGPKNKDQKMKLNQKPESYIKETENFDKASIIKTRSSKLDERLSKIVSELEKERNLDEQTKTQYPFTKLLSSDDRARFTNLSESDKGKVQSIISKHPTTDSDTILQLWETAIVKESNNEPLWLQLAPNSYREVYDKAPESLKESIQAKSEFFNLDTQYQIDNFWQQSGLKSTNTTKLNEGVVASKTNKSESAEVEADPLIEMVRAKMMTYNR